MDPPEQGHQSQPQPQQQLEQQQEQTTINIESPVTDEETTKRIKCMNTTFKIYHYSLVIVFALFITNVYLTLCPYKGGYILCDIEMKIRIIIIGLLFFPFPVIQLLFGCCFIRANTSDKSILTIFVCVDNNRDLSFALIQLLLCLLSIQFVVCLIMFIACLMYINFKAILDFKQIYSLFLYLFIFFINPLFSLLLTSKMISLMKKSRS